MIMTVPLRGEFKLSDTDGEARAVEAAGAPKKSPQAGP